MSVFAWLLFIVGVAMMYVGWRSMTQPDIQHRLPSNLRVDGED